jgi:hypothetical protein
VEDQPPTGGAGVEILLEAAEGDALVAEFGDRVDEMLETAAETIEAPHNERVAFSQGISGPRPTGAVGGGAAGVVLKHALAAGLGEGIALELEVLIGGADASIADDHGRPSDNSALIGFMLHSFSDGYRHIRCPAADTGVRAPKLVAETTVCETAPVVLRPHNLGARFAYACHTWLKDMRPGRCSDRCVEEQYSCLLMPSDSGFRQALSDFATQLTQNFSALTTAQPEDQLKRPVQNLIEALKPGVVTRTEASVFEVGGRPDIAVESDRLLAGHIELKAPGLGANPSRFRDPHSRGQWRKFAVLPNLVYTDGSEWRLFRTGEEIAAVRLHGDVTTDGAAAFTPEEAVQLRRLLDVFLAWEPIVPTRPETLAELLAPLCRLVRDDVIVALRDPDSGLAELSRDWRSVLFPDTDDAQFADAYAQTLTYALLLARFSGARDVDPDSAARTLDSGHGLLAGALRVLGNVDVRQEVGSGLDAIPFT